MTKLSLIFVVLLALAGADTSPVPVDSPWLRALGIAVAISLLVTGVHLATWRLRHRLESHPHQATRWGREFFWTRQIHLMLWLSTAVGTTLWGQWPQVVRGNWQWGSVPLADDLLVLVPLLLPLLACWPAFYRFEYTVERLIAIQQSEPAPKPQLLRHLSLECQENLSVVLAPLLLVLAVQDTLRLGLSPAAVERYGWVVHIGMLSALLLWLPHWLRAVWHTRPLPAGQLRTRLESAARRVGLGLRDLLVWPTGHQVANAVVAGFVPRGRYIYLTDRLIDLLTEEELEAVVLHEAAHIRRRHLWVRMLILVLPLAMWAAVSASHPTLHVKISEALMRCGVSPLWQKGLLLPCFACGYAALAIGIGARLLEFDADLWAMQRQAGDSQNTLITALTKLADISSDAESYSWLHPSLNSRIAFLEHARYFPESALRFQRQVRWASLGLSVLVASLMMLAIRA